VVIDTAGVRKKGKMADSIEFYSYVRATRSVERADIVLFLIDATLAVSAVDKKLARFIGEEHKSCIIVINKWDLAKDTAVTDDYGDYLTKLLPGLRHCPIAFTTATEAKNIQSVLDLATEIFKQASSDVPTTLLNKAIEEINAKRIPGTKGKRGMPRILYGTQVAKLPISILLFVNHPHLFDDNSREVILDRPQSIDFNAVHLIPEEL